MGRSSEQKLCLSWYKASEGLFTLHDITSRLWKSDGGYRFQIWTHIFWKTILLSNDAGQLNIYPSPSWHSPSIYSNGDQNSEVIQRSATKMVCFSQTFPLTPLHPFCRLTLQWAMRHYLSNLSHFYGSSYRSWQSNCNITPKRMGGI